MPPRRKPLTERLWSRIDKNGPVPSHRPDLGPCWLWLGQTSHGYGRIARGGNANETGSPLMVHRVVYEEMRGPIPEGLEPDHLCLVKHCCNPWHIEPVAHRENLARGPRASHGPPRTHCKHGHPFDAANTYVYPDGHRGCRECARRAHSGFETRQRRFSPKRRPTTPRSR